MSYGAKLQCSHDTCEAEVPGDKWSVIKSDWFYLKDGTQYCSEHIPDWVESWRARRAS